MRKIIFELIVSILGMPRVTKRLVALAVDLCLCVVTVWISYYLRLGEFVPLVGNAFWAVGASICLAIPIFIFLGLYRAIFRYSGWPALLAVARAVGIYGLLFASIFTAIGIAGVPRTIGIIQPILLLLFVGASRSFARIWLGDQYHSILMKSTRPRVLIYGAGSTGRQLVDAMSNNQEMQVVGFLDDNELLHGHVLNGQHIYDPEDLGNIVNSLNVSKVLLAMPRLSRKNRNEILIKVRKARVAVRTLPSMTDLAKGNISISELRELDIDDLIGREQVIPNQILLTMNVIDKVVMVTGAGGSIGSELCRQILLLGPSKILLIDQSEFALYGIHQELEQNNKILKTILVPLLASVQDIDRMREIMSTWNPDTIYHAAAYKHVPLVEHNPVEGIKNNVLGTLSMAKAAADVGIRNFVLISTDKAVRPTNIMGASKRLAEMVLQAIDETDNRTKFCMVRFGNVLGSSGSVVPKFRQQISEGGPITLTHSEITRFFMTITEAAQLVIQAGAMSKGGDVFILDMGEPVKIMELAERMIELSGKSVKDEKNPSGDIEIKTTGLRPGEKLFEELLIGEDPEPTIHPKIMKANEKFIPWADLEGEIRSLEIALAKNDVTYAISIMKKLVVGFKPAQEIVDWVHLELEAHCQPALA